MNDNRHMGAQGITTKDEWCSLFGGREIETIASGSDDGAIDGGSWIGRSKFVRHNRGDDKEFNSALTSWRKTAELQLRDAFGHNQEFYCHLARVIKVTYNYAARLKSANFEMSDTQLDSMMGVEMIRAIRAGEIREWSQSWPLFSILLREITEAGVIRKMVMGFTPGRSRVRYTLPLSAQFGRPSIRSSDSWADRIVVDKDGHHLHADSYVVRADRDKYARTVMVEVAFDGWTIPTSVDAHRYAWLIDERTSRLPADAGFDPDIPDGYRVVDGCGKKTCVRPDHLLCLPDVHGWWHYQRDAREGTMPRGFACDI